MTIGYYIGGGLHMCWMHVFRVPGLLDAIIERGQDPEALEPTCTFDDALQRFIGSYKSENERKYSHLVVSDLQERINERVHRLQQERAVKMRTQ